MPSIRTALRGRTFPPHACVAAIALFVCLAPLHAGTVDRSAIRRMVQDFSLAGIEQRLGPDYAFYHPVPDEVFEDVWMPFTKQDPGGRPYQVGGPWTTDAGDYSTTQGQVLYLPDTGGFPVDRFNALEWSNGCFSERPQPPWWGGFRPEPASAKWISAARNALGMPVAMARGMGSWANCGVIVFSSGLVATAGTSTAPGTNPSLRFPRTKMPTAIAVTSKNEFALVAVCDVRRRKGQVAVISLQGSGKHGFVHDWPDDYPCLPSTAWLSGMKLLGYIDLPGIEFPSGITAVGNRQGIRLVDAAGRATMLSQYDLSKQQNRDVFRTGSNADYASMAGFAVVVSREENKAAFIDLQPLFQRVHELYFTTQEKFRKTRNLGPRPTQWPFTFAADRSWKPRVVSVIDVPSPTATIASMAGDANARACIASLDGNVGVYDVGGLATGASASAAQIQRVGEVRVGRNPACLAYQKLSTDTVIAVSRGDREIAWIQNGSAGPRVIRRLRDARLIDPVFVEMADTHGIETSLITVADFHGRKLVNYRFSPVIFASQGGATFGAGPNGADDIECGGTMELPGCPWCISATNLN